MAVDPNDQTVRIYRGEDVSLDFSSLDATDVTDWDLTFTVRLKTTLLLTLTRDDGDIEVTDESTGDFSVYLTREQTSDFASRNLRWDVWKTVSGSYRRLAGGPLVVLTPELAPA